MNFSSQLILIQPIDHNFFLSIFHVLTSQPKNRQLEVLEGLTMGGMKSLGVSTNHGK